MGFFPREDLQSRLKRERYEPVGNWLVTTMVRAHVYEVATLGNLLNRVTVSTSSDPWRMIFQVAGNEICMYIVHGIDYDIYIHVYIIYIYIILYI